VELPEAFRRLLSILNAFNVPYTLNPNLVRGLDYYTKTTFEVTSEHLARRRLLQQAAGRPAGPRNSADLHPRNGFAVGMERLVTLLKEKQSIEGSVAEVFVCNAGQGIGT